MHFGCVRDLLAIFALDGQTETKNPTMTIGYGPWPSAIGAAISAAAYMRCAPLFSLSLSLPLCVPQKTIISAIALQQDLCVFGRFSSSFVQCLNECAVSGYICQHNYSSSIVHVRFVKIGSKQSDTDETELLLNV